MNFPTLHPRLAADTLEVCDLQLCQVRLMNDQRFPWLILVPRREHVSEIIDLTPGDQTRLMRETALVSRVLQFMFKPDKLNVAALGNMVPQLHVHVIARFKADAAWPNPVWGQGVAEGYADAGALVAQLRASLNGAD